MIAIILDGAILETRATHNGAPLATLASFRRFASDAGWDGAIVPTDGGAAWVTDWSDDIELEPIGADEDGTPLFALDGWPWLEDGAVLTSD